MQIIGTELINTQSRAGRLFDSSVGRQLMLVCCRVDVLQTIYLCISVNALKCLIDHFIVNLWLVLQTL